MYYPIIAKPAKAGGAKLRAQSQGCQAAEDTMKKRIIRCFLMYAAVAARAVAAFLLPVRLINISREFNFPEIRVLYYNVMRILYALADAVAPVGSYHAVLLKRPMTSDIQLFSIFKKAGAAFYMTTRARACAAIILTGVIFFAAFRPVSAADSGKSVPELARQIGDKDARVRARAAEALGRSGDKNAAAPLAKALKDENALVRGEAAHALGRIKDPAARATLIEALKSEDKNIRWGAIDAISEAREIKAVDLLIGLLSHEDRNTRSKAVTALGNIKDKRAVPPLIKTLRGDKDAFVRQGAIEALLVIGDRRAVPALQEAKKDNDATVRVWAGKALEKLGGGR